MKFNKVKTEERRKFFANLSKGAVGLAIISLLPKSFWKSAEDSKQVIPVKINSHAVKRTNRK